MKVWNPATSPSCTAAHLQWVPGRQTVPAKPGLSRSTPAICVSSPRMTSARGLSWDSPGRMRTSSPATSPGGVTAPSVPGATGTGR